MGYHFSCPCVSHTANYDLTIGWKKFFNAFWDGFGRRLDPILDSLAHHSDMVDKEAVSINISRAETWRKQMIEQSRKQALLQTSAQFHSVLAWLKVQSYVQEDVLDEHLRLIHANSCDWFQGHKRAKPWLASSLNDRALWIKGNPGAGQ